MKISPDMPIDLLLEAHPRANEWLMKRGIHCIRCGEPVWGSIGERIASKGLDIEKTLSELEAFLASLSPYDDL